MKMCRTSCDICHKACMWTHNVSHYLIVHFMRVYNIFQWTSSSYAQISTIVSIFQWPCCSECLSFYLIRCRYCHWNSYSSYQHQNIHPWGTMIRTQLEYLSVEGSVRGARCTSASIQAHLWHIPWPWSLWRAWRCCLGFVYGSQLVYYEPRCQRWRDVGPRCFISCQGLLQLN